MAESRGSQGGKKKDLQSTILATGIPLEMAVYSVLVSASDSDWVEPGYDFTVLDERGSLKQRSLDFVVSVPSSRDPLGTDSIHLYFLVECKYCNPKERVWLFMPDAFPRIDPIFDVWRPSLWQDRAPQERMSEQEIARMARERRSIEGDNDRGFPRCVRGAVLGESDGKRLPDLSTAMYQLRGCLHHLAIERFRLFTKQWHKAAALVFVPIVVTNAELRVLNSDVYGALTFASNSETLDLAEVAVGKERLLVRCPSGLEDTDWNWQRFQAAHGTYDLSRIEKGLPAYNRERTIEAHLRNFFACNTRLHRRCSPERLFGNSCRSSRLG